MRDQQSRGVNQSDLVAGLAVVIGCGVAAWIGAGYGLGTPRRMGAGAFPFVLSLLGMGLGALVAVMSVTAPQQPPVALRWRRLFYVTASFLLFAVAIEPLGLLLTIPLVTVIGAKADPTAKLGESALLGIGLALALWVVFVRLLGLGIPVLPGVG
ncbi:tripartite tricarboxylate transporter TctB family protein [Aestuariivita sp.]|jgi:hypothetical protein|uniref:tripartite tricarboxylate transporter TctB family protein n=1 Tax=Aestuariivita sp. TaxID=1872407 RepID=UPI002170B3B7|nr:tripartite tricarboxylate transporter TctB family protein [Aestuariivita sp.]MCE8005628.1 tripartite tricarboxylate transporter TctB family protein [Aestuariivita sp.]